MFWYYKVTTMITSYRPRRWFKTDHNAKDRAITDKMLNSARANLISIDHTTALICAPVLTRARYWINGMNEVSACVLRITDVRWRTSNCDVILLPAKVRYTGYGKLSGRLTQWKRPQFLLWLSISFKHLWGIKPYLSCVITKDVIILFAVWVLLL